MALIDRRTSCVVFTLLLWAASLLLIYAARRTVLVVVFAIVFAYVLEPAIVRVQPWVHGTRVRAIAATYLALLILLVVLSVSAAPRIAKEAQTFVHNLPTLLENVRSGQIAFQIGGSRGWSFSTQTRLQELLTTHREQILQFAQSIGARAAEVATNLGWVLLIPILAFFFLKDKSYFGSSLLAYIESRSERQFLRKVFADIDVMLAQYIRAQLLLALFAVIAYTTFLLIVRFPYGLALGVFTGMLEFIPFVGPLMTIVILLGVGFLTNFPHMLLLLGFLVVWRLLQDYVNGPYLMKQGLELHPAVAIIAVLVGGEVGGVAGMFLSVPIVASLRIIWENWQLRPGAGDDLSRPTPIEHISFPGS